MAEPFLAEIRICSFSFAPKGWAQCNGQLLPINQNQALFSLLGTTYGGNGQTNFALPDLRGRMPAHSGTGHGETLGLGERGGEEAHSLSVAETAGHSHRLRASTEFTNNTVPGAGLTGAKKRGGLNIYAAAGSAGVAMHAGSIAPSSGGGSQPHNNLQPYLALNFVIALQGIFPSQT
jgi:microcystin-dependent protein